MIGIWLKIINNCCQKKLVSKYLSKMFTQKIVLLLVVSCRSLLFIVKVFPVKNCLLNFAVK